MTDDGAHDRLYVDGQLVDTAPAIPFDGHGPIKIGGNALFGQWFDGRIDELRIYERALGQAEIAADMEAPLQTPKATPVAAYAFDEGEGETAQDVTGDGHTATIEGAEWVRGRYGDALKFDGEDTVTIPTSEELNLTEEFTLEAWISPEAGCEFGQVFVKEDAEEDHAAYVVSKHGSKLGAYLGVPGVEEESPSGSLEIGAWQHVAVTFDGSKARLYVDGEEVGSAPVDEILSTGGDLRIGGSHIGSHGGGFVGRIDEIRIYNRNLGSGEIAADMETPIQTPKLGPIAAWSFDEGEGATAEDLTGDGHAATIEGAIWARGKYGGALQFDGEDDVVKIPNSPEFDLTEGFTLEAWVRPESESNEWAPILAKEMGGGEAADELAWWLYEGDWNANEPLGGTEPTPGNKDEAHADDPLTVDAWSHVAVTYDGAKVRLYVDGELVDCSPTPAGAPPVTEGELQIGATTELGTYYKGRIDELRIYNRPLSESEIRQTLNAQFPSAITEEVSETEGEEAILNGTVDANGAPASYYFEFGTTEALGSVVMGEELGGNKERLGISEPVFDLSPETTYYARAVVEGIGGASRGKIVAFTTTKPTLAKEQREELRTAEEEYELTPEAKKGTPGRFYGMNWSGNLTKMKSEESYGTMKALGSGWFRLKLAPGKENEEEDEYAIERALAYNLKVLPYLGDGPFPKAGTTARENTLKFATRMVEKYRPYGITDWEVWNEPNMPFPLKEGETESPAELERVVNPPEFGEFLKEMSTAIKAGAGEEEVSVLGPGLFGYRTNECPNGDRALCHVTPVQFLREVNETGAKSFYDAVSIHPYVFRVGKRGEAQHAPGKELEDARRLREAVRRDLRRLKFDGKPIWVTEIGFPVANEVNRESIPPVSESFQKFLLRATFAMMANQRESLDLENVLYYNIQDENRSPVIWEQHCGLLMANGSRRPAWSQFKAFANP